MVDFCMEVLQRLLHNAVNTQRRLTTQAAVCPKNKEADANLDKEPSNLLSQVGWLQVIADLF